MLLRYHAAAMAPTQTSCELFLQSLTEAARKSFLKLPAPALFDLLAQTSQTARADWPTVDLEEGLFFAYLAPRVPAGEDPARSLSSLAVGDLYLACACAQKNERAIAALEARYFREIDHALGRLNAGASLIDDVKQQVRQHLFVGANPAIVNYSGSGQLRRWIRVIAVRALHRLRGPARKETADENNLIDALPDGAADPELLHIKQHYREAFRAAFAEAVTSLASTDRVLLSQHFIDGLNIDEIAALHHVHRATAARWVAQARESVAAQTRKLLTQRNKKDKTNKDNNKQLIQSQLDLSIRGHLRRKDS